MPIHSPRWSSLTIATPFPPSAACCPGHLPFFLEQVEGTVTGRQIAYPREALPETAGDGRLDPARFNSLDGFGIGSQILVAFEKGLAPEGLPALDDLARSVTDSSPILIIDMQRGVRIPHFAEVDANVESNEVGELLEEPALIIRPQIPLRFNTRYLVAIRAGLKGRAGAPLAPPEPFRRLRDGDPIQSPLLQKIKPAIEEVFSSLEGQGFARSVLVLAWDFQTASQEATRGRLSGMVTEALDSWLKLDDRGAPAYRAPQRFPFLITIPRCAAQKEDLPLLIFGHGLFRHQQSLTEDHQKLISNRLCMVTAAMDWMGLSLNDLISILKFVVNDFSALPRITDQLLQAHVNMQVLVQLLSGDFTKLPEMQIDGRAVTTSREIYYWGISNGGIQGTTFAALNDQIQRYTLNVPGGGWSMVLPRSSNFTLLNIPLSQSYPSALDRLILISPSQHLWDHSDPIVFAEALLAATPEKRILIQEAIDDVEVPNLATRVLARGLGITALTPAAQEVYGLTPRAGPLESAYVQWETHQPLKPPGSNVPAPSLATEESAHKIVRTLESCIQQMGTFLKPEGLVVHTCAGTCDPD